MQNINDANQYKSSLDGKILAFILFLYLLVFQSPLESVWAPFSYIDELISLIGIIYVFGELVFRRKFEIPRYMIFAVLCLAVFVASGLIGNILYRYQPLKSVVIDLYTNLKFFFAIVTGFTLFRTIPWGKLQYHGNLHARIITGFLFVVFLLDRVFVLYPTGIRHGIRSASLFYSSPTYLAGAIAFLLCLMTIFFQKLNYPFMAMNLIMIVFTMRSKAIASAMVIIALFAFLVLLKREMKLWHVLVLGIVAVVAAWPQIYYYFIHLSGWSARSVLLLTSFKIMKDFFPIGTGFGTYASSEAEKHYSPVYRKYGFHHNWELRDVKDTENTKRLIKKFHIDPKDPWGGPFLNDSFWPIIFGQTGVIGTIAYISALGILVKKSWELQKKHVYAFIAVMYSWIHLLICSMAEPAFNNATAIPLAIIMGIALCAMETEKFEK